MSTAWLDGAPIMTAEPLRRARSYGDGVFRTLLAWNGAPLDADGQAAHLAVDAARLGLEAPEPDVWPSDSQRALDGRPAAVLRWTLVRADAGRGYRPESARAHRLVEVFDLPAWPARCWQSGIAADPAPVRLACQPLLAGVKHLNRLEQVLASRDWPEGVEERLLLDGEGRLVCGTRSNLFWFRDGVWETPELARAGVAGRMRRRLLDMITADACPIHEVAAGPERLLAAEEAFVCNSLIGIWPLARCGDRRWTAPGQRTAALQAALAHPWTGG